MPEKLSGSKSWCSDGTQLQNDHTLNQGGVIEDTNPEVWPVGRLQLLCLERCMGGATQSFSVRLHCVLPDPL